MLRQPLPGLSNVARAGSWLNNMDQLLDSVHRNTVGGRGCTRVRNKGRGSAPTGSESYSISTPQCLHSSDLRKSLNGRRQEGEDARIIIERSRKRADESRRASPGGSGRRTRKERSVERSYRRSMSYSSGSDSESSPEHRPRQRSTAKNLAYTGQ